MTDDAQRINQLLTDNAALREELETTVSQAAADAFAFADEKEKLKAELEQVKAVIVQVDHYFKGISPDKNTMTELLEKTALDLLACINRFPAFIQ